MAALTAVQRVLAIVNGKRQEYVAAIVGGLANSYQLVALGPTGQIDVTMLPTGVGPEVDQMPASEALAAGALVNVYNAAGTATARNADGSTSGKEANGFVIAAVAQGATATVYGPGLNTSVTGLTPGPAFLSDTALGGVASAGATAAGHLFQEVGVVTRAGALQFNPSPGVLRA